MIWRGLVRNYCTTAASYSRLSISQLLKEKPLGDCQITGWIKSARKQKETTFLNISDGSSHKNLQIVVPTSLIGQDVKHHSAIRVKGELVESSHRGQDLELQAQNLEVINSCTEPYPIQPRKHFSQGFVRKFPGYKAKTNSTAALLRLRNHMSQEINRYFQQNGYIHIHTPVITSNDCEGGGEVFRVSCDNIEKKEDNSKQVSGKEEYFDKPVYLTVSGQLHLEAICNGISKVYTFNPAFRAEKGRTRRHLSEFWMVEAELAFVEDLEDVLDVMENLIKHVAKALVDHHAEDMNTYATSAKVQNRLEYISRIIENKFHRISFEEARTILHENSELPKVEDDFSREHELFLCDHLQGPVFVSNWPKSSKPFYMRECHHDCSLVSSVDLLVPGVGELCGGGLRELDANKLKSSIADNPDLDWYLDLRTKGSAPTGGFGLGFERLIQWLLDVENIKDTIPFYRTSHECIL
eukprot:TRINITY_DN3415_c0_g1_i1.p1 TRINITY_DN3415_c0_g1~~TRINITY_DN3415_c0_g1_i1.p1  ORF type:complete len:467 (+),score=58.53 TRINITY_DN3415_c0_g1_i1:42-1442(+)